MHEHYIYLTPSLFSPLYLTLFPNSLSNSSPFIIQLLLLYTHAHTHTHKYNLLVPFVAVSTYVFDSDHLTLENLFGCLLLQKIDSTSPSRHSYPLAPTTFLPSPQCLAPDTVSRGCYSCLVNWAGNFTVTYVLHFD